MKDVGLDLDGKPLPEQTEEEKNEDDEKKKDKKKKKDEDWRVVSI